LVKLFLNDKIKFTEIYKKMIKVLNLREFTKFKKIKVKKIEDIIDLNERVMIKMNQIIS